jgi:Domain of unknown function (DUF5642)
VAAQIDSLQLPPCRRRFVRVLVSIAAVAVCITGCGRPPETSPTGAAVSSSPSVQVKPANIARVRGGLPTGYEVSDITFSAAPVTLWGFGPGWTADPPQCAALAQPVVDGAVTRGWSASGSGGIVNAVVTGSPPDRVGLDPALLADCGQWRLSGGHTSGRVRFIDAPAIDGVVTVGLSTTSTTVVEGGTETHSHADTFTAYLGDYVAFVTVVTDPGSPNSPLGQDFAAELLVKTVSALRG